MVSVNEASERLYGVMVEISSEGLFVGTGEFDDGEECLVLYLSQTAIDEIEQVPELFEGYSVSTEVINVDQVLMLLYNM